MCFLFACLWLHVCVWPGVPRAVRTWPSRPAQAVFKVAPSMTKHEVKEHLTKIYDLPVQRVMTANFAGAYVVTCVPQDCQENRKLSLA